MAGSKSIADVAKAHTKDVNTVISAMVADAGKHIDEAVKAGKLDATKAADLKTHLTDTITKVVNTAMPKLPGGHKPGNRPVKPAATS